MFENLYERAFTVITAIQHIYFCDTTYFDHFFLDKTYLLRKVEATDLVLREVI